MRSHAILECGFISVFVVVVGVVVRLLPFSLSLTRSFGPCSLETVNNEGKQRCHIAKHIIRT